METLREIHEVNSGQITIHLLKSFQPANPDSMTLNQWGEPLCQS
jgi:hypothetical protein